MARPSTLGSCGKGARAGTLTEGGYGGGTRSLLAEDGRYRGEE